jgi:DNA-binding transcriptional LysR family regulator
MQQAKDALDSLRGLKRGVVRIGAVALAARAILPSVFQRMLTAEPGLRVHLTESSDVYLAPALLRREIDLAICGSISEWLGIQQIGECQFTDSFTAICRAGHPILDGRATLRDVLRERWILTDHGSSPRRLFEDTVRAAGHAPPTVVIETGSPNTIISLVASTDYLSWAPSSLFTAEAACNQICAIEIPELLLPRKLFVYRRDRGLMPEAMTRFLAELPLAQ